MVRVIGIIPELLASFENQHDGLTELHIVDSMHSRKIMLYEKCDAAVILPGGYGTLDEVFELLTWNQLNIHNKPIFFLNTNGFYDHLIAHIDRMHQEEFLYYHPNEKMTILNKPEDIIPFI
ncbi:MAG: TIGR00730 family Rossman fold protein [Ferruginibacter sp.]